MSLNTYPVSTSPIPFPTSQIHSSELIIVKFQQYKPPGIFLHIHKYTYFYKTRVNGNLCKFYSFKLTLCINKLPYQFLLRQLLLLTVLYSIIMLYHNLCNLFHYYTFRLSFFFSFKSCHMISNKVKYFFLNVLAVYWQSFP